MDITAIQGKINLSTVDLSKSLTAYVARPDAKIIARIRGIIRMDVKAKFVDISEIKFEVSKYTTNMSSYKFALNPVYNSLHAFCCILVPELGQYGLFRIEEEPEIVAKNIIDEKKVFTAYTYESILQYENLVRFDINQGTDTSLEMYSENINGAGVPMNKIQLYNPNNARLSLLNLVLEDDYYGWGIGHVDASVRSKIRAFSVDNQNVYSFLREDCQKAFGCIFDFDTIDKEINVYDAETVGNNTNVYLSFQNFVNKMNVSQTNDSAYTVFNVAGDNGLDISRVNFGSNKIVNISYPLSFLDTDIQDAYSQYVSYRESKRNDYINAYKRYTVLLGQRNSILDRQPQDAINNNWSSTVYYSLEDLQTDLQIYQSIVNSILLLYTKQDGTIDYDELDISPDASLYYSYHDVVIPDITAEIAARQSVGDDVAEEVDADVIWELYGLNDLELKLKSYRNIVSALTEQGYNNSWSSSSSISRDTWDAHHDEYTEYSGYVSELTALINSRKTALDDINDEIDECLNDIVSITSLVKLENYFARFANGSSYVATIKSLYKESDYKDDNYLITDFDDTTSIIAESELLLEAAEERLEIESRPQLTWSIDSDNLFAIPEFSVFRSHIQNGDFCTIVYGGDKTNYSPIHKENLDVLQGHLNVYNNENLVVNSYNNGINPRNRFYDTSYKMRIIEINFDGLNIGNDFELVFSDVITTTKDVSDVENLIGSFVSSRTNSIQAATLSTASSTARNIASSVIRPYIEAMQMQVANLSVSQVYADDIEALRAKVDTLIADYVEANKASIFDLRAGTISADKSITLVSRSGYGSIEMTNASMDFKDSSGNTRVHIGKSNNNSYSVDIYSEAGADGQTLLWSTDGITIDAIADGMITNAKLAQVSADKVTAGTLTSRDGSSYWNLDTGELSLNGYVINAKVEYALGDSPTIAPSSGWSTSSPTWTVGKYVWQKTTLTKTGSQPEVTTTCIQGASGRGISSITEYYAVNNSTSTAPTSWQTTFVAPTSSNPYLWNYSRTTYTDNSYVDSTKLIIGNYAASGSAGRGILSVTEYYGVSSSTSTEPSSYSTTMETTTTTNKYLWNYEVITYTDNTTEESTHRIIGTHGATGAGAYNYELLVSSAAVIKNKNNVLSPSSITFTGRRNQGTGSPSNYSGRFKIESTSDGSTWTTKYTSSSNEASKSYTVGSTDKMIRCTLYLAGGTSTQLDIQTIPVISDGKDGADGTSVTILGSYSTLAQLEAAHPTGSDGDAYIINGDLYVWVSNAWTNVGQIQGPAGVNGTNGADGTSAYVHFAYSTSSDGQSNFSTTYFAGAGYIGVRSDTTQADSVNYQDYVWSRIVGEDGADGYTVILTNESHTFAGDTDSAVSSSTECGVIAYKGSTQMAATIGTITGQVNGLTTQISSNGTTSAKFTVNVTSSLTATSGVLNIPVTVDGKSFTKKFSWSVTRDGRGIASVTEYYAINNSTSTQPSNWQTTFISPTSANPYLWNYSRTTYTDGNHDDTTAIVIGNYSSDGANGKGITAITEYYGISSATNTEPSSYSTTMVTTTTTDKYLWNYEVFTYSDGTTSESTHRIIGTHGATGTAAYNYELLSSSAAVSKDKNGNLTPTSITFTGRRNQGTGSPSNYSGRFKIEATADGSTWTTKYTSSSNEATKTYTVGSTDKMIRCTLYLGGGTTTQIDICTIPVVSDGDDGVSPTITSSKSNGITTVTITDASGTNTLTINDGLQGASIASITNYYLASASSSGVTTSTSGWTTNPTASAATMTSAKPYLWNYEVSKDTNNNTIATTSPSIIGRYASDGQAGAAGKGISSIDEYYALSSTTSAPADSSFSTSVKTPTSSNKYLWNYEIITYTDSTTTQTSKHIIGVYGDKGDRGDDGDDAYTIILTNESHTFAGSTTAALASSTECSVIAYKGITQIAATIGSITGQVNGLTTQISSNGTTSAKFTVTVTTALTNTSGVLNIPITADGKSFTRKFSWAVSRTGAKGDKGDTGNGVSYVVEYYAINNSNSNAPSVWQETFVSPTSSNPYLWNYSRTNYTDGTYHDTTPVIIGNYASNGTNGRGISSITEYYGVSASTSTEPSTYSTTMVATTTTNKYLWNYEVVTYTDSTTEESTHRIIGTHGATGTGAYNYELLVSENAIIKDKNGNLSTSSITFTGRRNQGTGEPSNYAGRFVIETTNDGTNWVTQYTSSANEATKTYNVSANNKLIRCTLHLAGGTDKPLDVQTIPIICDGLDGDNSILLRLVTPDGDTFVDNVGTLTILAQLYNGGVVDNSSVQSWSWAVYDSGVYVNISGETSSSITISGENVDVSKTYRCTAVYDNSTYVQYITITNISPSSAITLTTETFDNGESTTIKAKLLASMDDITSTYPSEFYSWYKVTEDYSCFIGHGYTTTVNNNEFEYGGVVRVVFSGVEQINDSIVRFVNSGDVSLIPSVVVNMEPEQDTSSGAPSSSNICPITGYTSVDVTRSGMNILRRVRASAFTSKGVTYTPTSDGGFTINGTATAQSNCSFGYTSATNGFPAKTLLGQRLRISFFCDSTDVRLFYGYYDKNGTAISLSNFYASAGFKEFSLPEDAYTLRTWLVVNKDVTINNAKANVMMSLTSETNNEYEIYNGETKTIDLSSIGTIYGGRLNVQDGELIVTHANIASYNGETLPSTWLSSMDEYSPNGTPTTGAQVVYKLSEPIKYKVQQNLITALSGVNNIWSNVGDVTVDYYTSGDEVLISGEKVPYRYIASSSSSIKESVNVTTAMAVYEVEPDTTYYVTFLNDANRYIVAFGNTPINELVDGSPAYDVTTLTKETGDHYRMVNTNYRYIYIYYTIYGLNTNHLRVTRKVPFNNN